jgi:NAD(P)-dependent dehydrogenase (short-subunit alcohol dehydrogenase family)
METRARETANDKRPSRQLRVSDAKPTCDYQCETVAALVADAGKEESAIAAVDLAKSRFGKVDILVNNAARIVYKPAVEMTLADWNSILDVTSTGVFLHSREALKAIIPNESGAIINIGSYACAQTFPGISAYAAAKGALAQITRTFALEAIEHGIQVIAIGAGDVVTNLLIRSGRMGGSSWLNMERMRPSSGQRNQRRSPKSLPFSPPTKQASLLARS